LTSRYRAAGAYGARHVGNEHVVNLFELDGEQSVERKFQPNSALSPSLSHVRGQPPERRLSPCV